MNLNSVDTLSAALHAAGWSYGYTAYVADGALIWLADARKGHAWLSDEGHTLEEALRALWKLTQPESTRLP